MSLGAPLDIRPNLERNPWQDLDPQVLATAGTVERVGLLPNATSQGRCVFALLVRLPDGTPVVATTTWRMMNTAARALAASPEAQREAEDL